MEAVSTSETSVNFYQTTRRNIPEDSHLRGNESSGSINGGDFLDQLSDYQLSTRILLRRVRFTLFPKVSLVQCGSLDIPTVSVKIKYCLFIDSTRFVSSDAKEF
jgi:hypothetical protein